MQHSGEGLRTLRAGKQTPSSMAFVAGLLATFFLVGCSMTEDSADGSGLESWEVEEASATGDATAEEALITSSADEAVQSSTDDAVIEAGCSIVDWCNAPGADGTRCRQQGCTLQAARNECINEAWQFCGTPVCPWIIVGRDGRRHSLCY